MSDVRDDSGSGSESERVIASNKPTYQPPSPPSRADGIRANFGVDLLLGIPILYVAFAALVGGFEQAGFFLLVAVVCTAGVSLVILLPLAWMTGVFTRTIITALLSLMRGARSAA